MKPGGKCKCTSEPCKYKWRLKLSTEGRESDGGIVFREVVDGQHVPEKPPAAIPFESIMGSPVFRRRRKSPSPAGFLMTLAGAAVFLYRRVHVRTIRNQESSRYARQEKGRTPRPGRNDPPHTRQPAGLRRGFPRTPRRARLLAGVPRRPSLGAQRVPGMGRRTKPNIPRRLHPRHARGLSALPLAFSMPRACGARK